MSVRPAQLPIDFVHQPAYLAQDFVVAGNNRAAFATIAGWPSWPARALALSGPAGSGKSHLAHLFAERTGALLVGAAALDLDNPPELAAAGRVVVEDADRGVHEQALLHLYNLLGQGGGTLLVTGRMPPARWSIRLPDLSSRLAAMPVVEIGPPDDDLLLMLLAKLFADRQLRVASDVPAYLVARMERSFDAARALVETIDRAALAAKRPVTVALAREILAEAGDAAGA